MKRLKTTGKTHANKAPTLIVKTLVVLWWMMSFHVAQAISVEEIERYSSPSPYGKARLSPDGKFLAVAADREGRDVVVILKPPRSKPITLCSLREKVNRSVTFNGCQTSAWS